MPETVQAVAQTLGASIVAALGGGWAAWRHVKRTASADKTAIARDEAERTHMATLQAENSQLRERHDSMSQKYADMARLAGELSGKVEAQTETIETLRAEVAALRGVVAEQSEQIATLQHQIMDLLTVAMERSGTGSLLTFPSTEHEHNPAQP